MIVTEQCNFYFTLEFGGDEEIRYKDLPLNPEEELNGSGNDSDEIENTNKLGEEELRRKSRQLSNQGIHGIIGKIEEIEI